MVLARRARTRPLLASAAPSLVAAAKKKQPKKKAVTADAAATAGATVEDASAPREAQKSEEAPESSESSRLREQLLHVLVDHQRQEEEIVALRALARSLKEEVELIHKQQQRQTHPRATSHTKQSAAATAAATYGHHREKRPHEFFKLDLQLDQLRSENSQLRDELCDAHEELERLRGVVARELPHFKIAAVQAKAELECAKSQLQDERAHCDQLEAQVAHYRARSSVPVPTPLPVGSPYLRKQPEHGRSAECERHREREQFLLQCRLSAVANGDGDKENSECSGNGGDGPSDAVDELSGASRSRFRSPSRSVASSRSSSS
ncbi:Beta-catenin-like protein, partial [Globisporangium polare]